MKVLMVCLGNICRSPLAQGILENQAKEKNIKIYIDSAGTAGYHVGSSPDIRAINIAKKYGIDITNQKARKFQLEDFDNFDIIYVMDLNNYNDLLNYNINEQQAKKIILIMNEVDANSNIAVPDPYYNDGFENVYQMLLKTCQKIVKKIESR